VSTRLPALPALVDEEAARRALRWSTDDDVAACPLPGHHRTAMLVPYDGELRLSCDCNGRSAEWPGARSVWRSQFHRALPDAYYAVWTGEVLERGFTLQAGLRYVWRLLLTHEMGLLEPDPIDLPHLPGADDVQHRTRDFFALLYGLKHRHGNRRPTAFTDRLVADYCHTDRAKARKAINALMAAAVIVRVDRDGPRGPFLWEPGHLAAAR
jgi:hypothetical protein